MTRSPTSLSFTTHDDLPPAESRLVADGLGLANDEAAPLHEVRPLSCFARLASGQVIGGAVGRSWGPCCELQQLWVEPAHRHQGIATELIKRFEAHGRTRGCHSFYLETFNFQAPALYQSLGYEPRHAHAVYPHGIVKYTMVHELMDETTQDASTAAAVARLAPDHAAEYRKLMLQAYAQHPEAFASSATERAALPLAWWAQRVAPGDAAAERVYGAFIDGALAGVAGLRFEKGEKTQHKAMLYGMYVPPAFRQHGLGRALVRAVLAGAAERAATRLVQLTVTEGNAPAQRLYEACGFHAFGTEPLAVRVGERFVAKIHMWRELAAPADAR